MKSQLAIVLGACMLCALASAFDPSGPPPEKTMAWTTKILSRNILPQVSIVDEPIDEVVAFIGIPEVPDAYKPQIDYSRIQDKKRKVSISGTDLTRMEALGQLAQAVNADILVSPGKVTLIPRTEHDGAGQPATRPVVEPEGGDKPQPETEGRSR